MTVFTIIYLVSLFIMAGIGLVIYSGYAGEGTHMGHVMFCVVVALVPAANTIAVAVIASAGVVGCFDHLSRIKIPSRDNKDD